MKTNRLAVAIASTLLVCAAGCAQRSNEAPGVARERDAGTQDRIAAGPERAARKDELGDGRLQPLDTEGAKVQAEPQPSAKIEGVAQTVPGREAKATGELGATASAGLPATSQPVFAVEPYEGAVRDPANREAYSEREDNPVLRTAESPVSTFSIDVDTGAYSNVRRMLTAGSLPPADAVRAEELINYFDYGYAPPARGGDPFSTTVELAPAPWNAQRTLMLVGIKGYEVAHEDIPASNLVFLIDTSGSMESADKIGLLRESLKLMVPKLRAQDRVSIVVYAGSAGLVLPPTPGDQRDTILAALDALSAGGSTNGGAGIELAYAMAQRAYIEGGVNRVVLATDGDFNVGTVDVDALKSMVAEKRKSGVALTTLGFGQGNYNDELAEQLADIGNGNHAYIDTLGEAHKVLCEELSATMLTIAKDVKIQIEFNPAVVAEYRLIGYENRLLRREDFNNDRIDAGEIGAGHDVTALYELTMAGSAATQIDSLRYAAPATTQSAGGSGELAFVKLRYKRPDGDSSRLIERAVFPAEIARAASPRLQFAAAVAGFADALRGGTHLGSWALRDAAQLARNAGGPDPFGYRAEFVALVDRAASLQTQAHARDQVAIAQ